MLRRAAWRCPDKTFLHWCEGNISLSYAETLELSGRVAGFLANLGIEKGDRVGIFAQNSIAYILSMFGAWRLGAISCHINALEAENLTYFANDSTPKVLLFSRDLLSSVNKGKREMPSINHYICHDGEVENALNFDSLLEETSESLEDAADGDDAAHLSYTSGSSGKPKGALLAHGPTARAAHCIAERLQMNSRDFTLGPTSPASSYGLVVNLLPSLHRCGTVGLMTSWDAPTAWSFMQDNGVTLLPANPLIFDDFLRTCRKKRGKPASLRAAPSGGAPVPPDLKKAFRDELGVHLVESYGQSEIGGFVALGYPRAEPAEREYAIGPALPDKEVRVMDENGNEVLIGQPGELCLRGGFMLGYWEMPEKTNEAIRDGWLHTGDMGVMDSEGYISMLGRWSERIVSNGKVLFPRPMEESLLRHPAVRYAAVIGKPDPQEGEIPKAIVVLHQGQKTNCSDLLAHCRNDPSLSEYPQVVEIISEMPMTPTGKIGRAALQQREKVR